MSNYTKTTNFAVKDSLVSGNAAKLVKGTEVNTEFDNIATAVATKTLSDYIQKEKQDGDFDGDMTVDDI